MTKRKRYDNEIHHHRKYDMEKKRITLVLTNEIVERMRDLAYADPTITMTEFARQALLEKLEDYESENGSIPKRQGALKVGRPVSA